MTQHVYLALYTHRHGLDHSVHKTREGALRCIAGWAKQWFDEFADFGDADAKQVVRTAIDDPTKHEDLLGNWDSYTGLSETFDVTMMNLED